MSDFNDWDKYALGDLVEVGDVEHNNNDGSWCPGMIVGIDYHDPHLPWAIRTIDLPNKPPSLDEIEDMYQKDRWEWYRDSDVRPGHFVDNDFVIQEENTLTEQPW